MPPKAGGDYHALDEEAATPSSIERIIIGFLIKAVINIQKNGNARA
jgi:hypothetical protein